MPARTHGMTDTPEYRTWCGMKDRCLRAAHDGYQYYGGRGIRIHEPWVRSFLAFLADVGNRPTPGHSLDRIDVNGNYEPGNVRWATRPEQMQNRRDNLRVTYRGETRCIAEWAPLLGINPHTLANRIRTGVPVELAFTRGRINGKTPRALAGQKRTQHPKHPHVCYDRQSGPTKRWIVSKKHKKRTYRLGSFATKAEAMAAAPGLIEALLKRMQQT